MKRTILFCILMLASPWTLAQDSKTIINSYIDSTGGIDNWRKIKSMYKESQARYKQPQYESPPISGLESQPFNLSITHRKWNPDRQKSATYGTGTLKMEIYSKGSTSYILFPNMEPVEPVTGPKYHLLLAVELFDIMNSDQRKLIKYLGTEKIENNDYYVVQVPLRHATLNCYFNIRSGLLDYTFLPKNKTRYTKTWDYRAIGDVKYPFQSMMINNGVKFFESRVTKLEFNVEIDDEVFEF